MSTAYKVSGATIKASSDMRTIRLVGYSNPEVIFPSLIRNYFLEIGFMEKYPYFKTLKIGSIHPFALLLAQEVAGAKYDMSLFPSITIADTSDAEAQSVLARDRSEFMLTAKMVAEMKYEYNKGTILASAENIARLEAGTLNDSKLTAITKSYTANHNIDLNIWADNKDMVSIIYDILKHFIISNIEKLHREYNINIEESINGRRSGDINVDFGKLLYGSNITVPAKILTTSMEVNFTEKEITDFVSADSLLEDNPVVDISLTGDYHILGE